MNISQKRIMRDIKNFISDKSLEESGIHIIPNQNNLYNLKAMIIGPEKTPYEKGFYFFDVDFQSSYPMDHPKMKFRTTERGVRFNPNLYSEGKVCLSIIGTWSGPGWTSCMTLTTLLNSVQTLLNENPINNEPGYERYTKNNSKSQEYNLYINYQNVRFAFIEMMNKPPYGFDEFKPIMEKYFIKNYPFFIQKLEDFSKGCYENQEHTSGIYSIHYKFRINELKKKLQNLIEQHDLVGRIPEHKKENLENQLMSNNTQSNSNIS